MAGLFLFLLLVQSFLFTPLSFACGKFSFYPLSFACAKERGKEKHSPANRSAWPGGLAHNNHQDYFATYLNPKKASLIAWTGLAHKNPVLGQLNIEIYEVTELAETVVDICFCNFL